MKKRPYQKPEIKEVKLVIEDTLLSACRSGATSKTNPRFARRSCSACRTTYSSS